jgi:hypothetical protein
MPEARKRPCCICRRWFRPDARIGSRQRTCKSAECQRARRRKKQKAWRDRHLDYFIRKRIEKRGQQQPPPEPLRMPEPLSRLPWETAQFEFGIQGADFIGLMGKTLLEATQSQFEAYVADSKEFADTLPPPAAQSQIRPVRESVRIQTTGHEAGISSTGPPI